MPDVKNGRLKEFFSRLYFSAGNNSGDAQLGYPAEISAAVVNRLPDD